LLAELAGQLQVHVLTADTFGRATAEVAGLPVRLTVVRGGEEAEAKLRYVQSLTATRVVAIGNGRNDVLMLGAAAVGIAVVQREGGAAAAIGAADVIATSVLDALELRRNPRRLMATLRS
jgi:soluble P-type ATPase